MQPLVVAAFLMVAAIVPFAFDHRMSLCSMRLSPLTSQPAAGHPVVFSLEEGTGSAAVGLCSVRGSQLGGTAHDAD